MHTSATLSSETFQHTCVCVFRPFVHDQCLYNTATLLSSLRVSRTGSAIDWCALQEELYKCIDTIQYNTIQYNTIQYNTEQYNIIQYNTIQYNSYL